NIPVNNLIDGEKIKGARFRKRKPGDRFKFPNAAHSKSIKNLFRDKNIPENARDGLIFLADEEHILWIEKIGVSEYAKVTEGTVTILQLQVDCL
ncbi:MAG: tRNA lysidine(34) synthetase TilS, partial [Clostridiales bacterium]|nr:tRNA lysidine(34) synthetase TilS [Clostridiales bacterium]